MMRRSLFLIPAVLALSVLGVPEAHAVPSFHLKFADAFNTPVKLGSFSGCDHNADTPQAYCTGLSGTIRSNWWSYPDSWPDTATQRGYKVGGYYHPEDTVWVSPSPWGDGQLHIRMYRPRNGGPNHSATVVPKPAMGMVYGKFEIRERVSHPGVGFKSAQLRWPVNDDGCSEVDYPESEHDQSPDAFYHPSGCSDQLSYSTRVDWTQWHTYDIEATPSGTSFWLDGKEVGKTSDVVKRPQDWDIQNESALNGESAAPGTWDQIDITYVKVWSYS